MLGIADEDEFVERAVAVLGPQPPNFENIVALNRGRTERMTVPELHARGDRDGMQILDVRGRDEWDAGRIPGSVHRPYHDLHELPEELDPQRPVAVICGSGQRSAVAASLLQRLGAREVVHVVDGGVPLWVREGWPVERG